MIKNNFIKKWREIWRLSPNLEPIDISLKASVLRRFSIVYLIFVVFSIYLMVRVCVITTEQPKYRIVKKIKIDLNKAILANCTYEDLRIIYDRKERINIRNYFEVEIYEMPVDLAYILEDMIFDYYNKDLKDSSYVNKLRFFITEAKTLILPKIQTTG